MIGPRRLDSCVLRGMLLGDAGLLRRRVDQEVADDLVDALAAVLVEQLGHPGPLGRVVLLPAGLDVGHRDGLVADGGDDLLRIAAGGAGAGGWALWALAQAAAAERGHEGEHAAELAWSTSS